MFIEAGAVKGPVLNLSLLVHYSEGFEFRQIWVWISALPIFSYPILDMPLQGNISASERKIIILHYSCKRGNRNNNIHCSGCCKHSKNGGVCAKPYWHSNIRGSCITVCLQSFKVFICLPQILRQEISSIPEAGWTPEGVCSNHERRLTKLTGADARRFRVLASGTLSFHLIFKTL